MATRSSRVCTAAYFAAPGEASQPLRLGYEAVLDGRAVVHRLACEPPALSADLIEVAATVYAVDRLVACPTRLETSAGSSWARDLRPGIPVREPQLWNAYVGQLTELLAWLTDDTWSLEFFQLAGGTGPLDEPQAFLFHTIPRGSASVLFSGGLDSAAGLAAMLWQVTRLRTCLTRPDPWQALVSEFPEILDTAPLTPTEVINLYRSYVQECDGLQGAFGIGRTAA